jgi:hypothetical protein
LWSIGEGVETQIIGRTDKFVDEFSFGLAEQVVDLTRLDRTEIES